eukprot:3672723-Amphidinium_carterae.1
MLLALPDLPLPACIQVHTPYEKNDNIHLTGAHFSGCTRDLSFPRANALDAKNDFSSAKHLLYLVHNAQASPVGSHRPFAGGGKHLKHSQQFKTILASQRYCSSISNVAAQFRLSSLDLSVSSWVRSSGFRDILSSTLAQSPPKKKVHYDNKKTPDTTNRKRRRAKKWARAIRRGACSTLMLSQERRDGTGSTELSTR